MKHVDLIEESRTQARPIPGYTPAALENAYKKDGLYDGKIFHSDDKVTYTFLTDQEVVSLHYDLKRDTIFYKGHKIDNLELSWEQKLQLEKFGKVLEEESESASFAPAYQKALRHCLQNNSR
ncbi:MAG: hypothetical protein Q7T11_09535 [Deltaproteobacteria bacterium]|nr:hypothetical protein [Deltaproteobacteria bacterium]